MPWDWSLPGASERKLVYRKFIPLPGGPRQNARVKVHRSPLDFEPRRWRKPDQEISTNPLEAEHPTFVRGIDAVCLGSDLGLFFATEAPLSHAAAGLGVVAAAGMVTWGLTKWKHGETSLDRIEAVGSLAAGTGYATESLRAVGVLGGLGHSVAGAALYTYAASDLFLGGVDAWRGYNEGSNRRLAAGLAQMANGGCMVAMELFPASATGFMWGMVGATLARQVAVGMPGEPLDPATGRPPERVRSAFR